MRIFACVVFLISISNFAAASLHPVFRPEFCVNAVSQFVAPFEMDEQYEILEVTRACARNYNGACVFSACQHLGAFGCRQRSDAAQVAAACSLNLDAQCLNITCQRSGVFACNEMNEVINVARACGGGF